MPPHTSPLLHLSLISSTSISVSRVFLFECFTMVATRRRRVPAVVPESSASPEPSVRDIDIELQALRRASVASAQSSPTASPSPAPSQTMPTDGRSTCSHSNQSATSFAGPGQRGAQLLSVAPSSARFSYLNAFENMNDVFATQLRARGVALPGRKHQFFCSFPSLQASGGLRQSSSAVACPCGGIPCP